MSPANHYYRDLDLLHAEYDQLSQTLVESRESGENAPVERIVKFLKDVNIFYDI